MKIQRLALLCLLVLMGLGGLACNPQAAEDHSPSGAAIKAASAAHRPVFLKFYSEN